MSRPPSGGVQSTTSYAISAPSGAAAGVSRAGTGARGATRRGVAAVARGEHGAGASSGSVTGSRGGTRASIREGRAWVEEQRIALDAAETVPMQVCELVIGTVCGGSDGTSGITGNPAAGRAFDQLIAEGAACIFEETGELIGCEHIMAARAITPELGAELEKSVAKAARYYATLGYGSFAAGNAEGGLSTIEEKSMGAYAKSGASPISGLIKPGDIPPRGGLYLLDVVPDGEVRFGFPNINDNAEIAELIACGSHVILFVTGRGSVVGSAISPVVKICANPETWRRMEDDMDIDAGRILQVCAEQPRRQDAIDQHFGTKRRLATPPRRAGRFAHALQPRVRGNAHDHELGAVLVTRWRRGLPAGLERDVNWKRLDARDSHARK